MAKSKYVHSFSAVDEYKNCPRKMYENRILKRFPFVETDATRYGNYVHKAFENRIGPEKTPLPKDLKVHVPFMQAIEAREGRKHVELKLGITRSGDPCGFFEKQRVWFRGVIDLIVEDGEEALIIDYKTSAKFRPQYMKTDQLLDSAVLVFAHFPDVKRVKAGLAFVVHDKMFPEDGWMVYERDKFDEYLNVVHSDARPVEESMGSGQWPESPNPLCGYCPVKECQHWYDAKARRRK